jgi:hypothetical protein
MAERISSLKHSPRDGSHDRPEECYENKQEWVALFESHLCLELILEPQGFSDHHPGIEV